MPLCVWGHLQVLIMDVMFCFLTPENTNIDSYCGSEMRLGIWADPRKVVWEIQQQLYSGSPTWPPSSSGLSGRFRDPIFKGKQTETSRGRVSQTITSPWWETVSLKTLGFIQSPCLRGRTAWVDQTEASAIRHGGAHVVSKHIELVLFVLKQGLAT